MALTDIDIASIAAARQRLNDLVADVTKRTHGYTLRISQPLDAVFMMSNGNLQWAPFADVLLAELRAPWALVGIENSWVCGEGIRWRDIEDRA